MTLALIIAILGLLAAVITIYEPGKDWLEQQREERQQEREEGKAP